MITGPRKLRKTGLRGRSTFPDAGWAPALLICLACLLQGCTLQEDYEITITNHQPGKASPGETAFLSHVFFPGYFLVALDGEVLWRRLKQDTLDGNGVGLDVRRDGSLLIMHEQSRPAIVDPLQDEVLWAGTGEKGHHTLAETPWGSILTLQVERVNVRHLPWILCPVYGDVIVEIDVPSGDVVWEWHLKDHVDPVLHHADDACEAGYGILDWSHCNTVKILEDYVFDGRRHETVVLLLSRNLNTFWMIDHASGEVIWSCGQHGDFGRKEPPAEPVFCAPHEIEMLENGHFLLFDNGDHREVRVSRALEISADPLAGTLEEVWSWTDPGLEMFSRWGGDADRLENGNTLVTDVQNARLIEVDPAGEKVWELSIRDREAPEGLNLYTIFMGKRIP